MSARPRANERKARRAREAKLNELRIAQEMSTLLSRSMLARRAGQHFDGDRDLYKTMGYIRTLTAEDYLSQYLRGDIAGRIIDAYPDATWREPPVVSAADEDGGKFADAVHELDERIGLWSRLARADRLANIGHYGVILCGFDGGDPLWSPLRGNDRRLIYLKPHSEVTAEISKWDNDPSSPRYGKPEMYNITIGSGRTSGVSGITTGVSTIVRVHWTRVIHIAEKPLDDDSIGLPRLERVFNRLMDVDKLLGSSAEIFWNNAAGLWALKADPELEWDPEDKKELEEQLQEMSHGLRRWLRLRGIEPENIAAPIADPRNFVEGLLDVIAGATGIPKRILVGSERGELSSEQDENNWAGRVNERRATHAIPNIVRPLLDMLILRGALPKPAGGRYNVEWEGSDSLGEETRARIADIRASALQKYMNTLGAEEIVPPREFRAIWLGLEPEPDADFLRDMDDRPLDETDPVVADEFNRARTEEVEELDMPSVSAAPANIATTALNSTQIGAIRDIALAVALGQLPADSAVSLIKAGFPFIDDAIINGIITPLINFTPAQPVTPAEAEVVVNKALNAALKLTTNAKPRTLYVRRDVLNWREIDTWAREQGIETTLGADMHVTIAFSRTPVDWLKIGEAPGDKGQLIVPPGGPRLVERLGPNKEAVVLMFSSSELAWRHEDIKRCGASWDWPDYQPHITITYDSANIDVSKLEPFRGEIKLGPEIFEEIDEDWKAKVEER